MSNNKSLSIKTPWENQAASATLNETIRFLVETVHDKHISARERVVLTKKEVNALQRQFNDSQQCRGPVRRYMCALAKAINVDDSDSAVLIPKMKEWDRAAEKSLADGRNLHDLNRGTLWIKTPEQAEKIEHFVRDRLDEEGFIKDINNSTVYVLKEDYDNYITSQRSSGFSGGINMDVGVNFSGGRKGCFEIQVKPEQYQRADKESHLLFDLIRVLDEIPKPFRTEDQKKIKTALITSNTAIFDEAAYKYDFMKLRDKEPTPLSRTELRDTNDILDRIHDAIDNLAKPYLEWRKETQDAMTSAKSSLFKLDLRMDNNSYSHSNDHS